MKTRIKYLLSIVATLAVVLLLKMQSGLLSEILLSIQSFRPSSVWVAFGFVLLQVFFQVLRLFVLFSKVFSLNFAKVGHSYCIGQLVNNFIPARAGDLVKAAMVSRNNGPSIAEGTGVVVADKLADVLGLLLFIAVSGAYGALDWKLPEVRLGPWLGGVVVIVGLSSVLFMRYKDQAKFSRLARIFTQFKSGVVVIVKPSTLGLALVFGIGSWCSETVALIFLASAKDIQITFSQAALVLCILNLAIAIPVTVANIGTFEASLIYAFSRFGVPLAISAAIGTVHHFLQIVSIATLAFIFWFITRLTLRQQHQEFHVKGLDKFRALEYFEKVSRQYDETVNKGILRYPRERERKIVLRLAAFDDVKASVIDVGCGAGFFALAAKRAGMKVCAVDASQGMVARLSGKVDETRVADLESLTIESTYDRVVCAGVLDFVLNPELAFTNLCRLVSPRGRLIVLAPRVGPGGLFYRVEKFFFGYRINLYRLSWFKEVAGRFGLRVVEACHPLPTNMAVALERV